MVINKIFQSIKIRGIKGTINHAIGLDKRQEEIDTLYYLLNEVTDITKIGPTKNKELRIMQLCNAALLSIFDKLCMKYHLTYWLDFGTLLGAVRHGGFIPWDDDLDVSMPREDYDKVIPLMKEEMEKYGIVVRWGGYYDDMGYMARLAFAYRTLETGVWMDIYPMDYCYFSEKADKAKSLIESDISKYQKYYAFYQKKQSVEELTNKKKEIFSNIPKGENKIWYIGPEILWNKSMVMDNETIFPIKKIDFEGYSMNIPADVDSYLKMEYGDTYMEYPKGGVEHHTDPDGGLARDRARKHNVDMNEVLAYLNDVAKKI